MHIVIDARIINSSTGTYVERLLHYLQQIDTENTYTILVPEKDRDYWQPSGFNFKVVPISIDNYSFAEQTRYRKILDDLRPDLVHFCMPQQPILYRGKTVTTFHDLNLLHTYNSDKNWFVYHCKQLVGRFVFYRIAHTSDHIITPTRYTRDELVKFSRISPNKTTVTYEAAEIDSTPTDPYNVPFKRYIMYVGQQSDYKNIRRLAEAHQLLLASHPDLGLVLVGRKQIDARANERYFHEKKFRNIHFTDFLPDSQRNWLYEHCEAYVFPSLMEGFGLPGLEAMAYGAPVVSSNATCLPEVYGSSAYYFDPTNTQNIAQAIDEVISNPQLQQTLRQSGARQVRKYSWMRMAEETKRVYETVLQEK